MGNNFLTYYNQLEFKTYAATRGLARDKYYFDYVSCVDSKTARDIPAVIANGTITWDQAFQKLKCYFEDKKFYLKKFAV